VKDFSSLVKLMTDNGLTDVSHLGVAAQSSLSQWSRPNDAQRATQDNTWDYAFHTGEDSRAWWTLTFPRRRFVSHIILENRRTEDFQDRSADISVYCSGPAGEELVHSRNVTFGALPRQLPLIIAVNEYTPVTAIRIERNTPGALHLSRVRVLCNAEVEGRFGGMIPTFVAQNPDGYGERLRAMMNAMLMAEAFGGRFYFNWGPLQRPQEKLKAQSVDDRKTIFSPKFIRAHHVSRATLKKLNIGEFHSLPQNETFADCVNRYDGVTIRQSLAGFHREALAARNIDLKIAYPRIFEKIAFAPPLARMKDLADSVDLAADTVALHLRAGDVIYGAARGVGRFAGKCFPYPLVTTFIRDRTAAGDALLVFGQDEDFLTALQRNQGVRLARDYLPANATATEAALFEICLMSRCKEICAGSSGFAYIASWRGGAPISSLYNLFEPARARAIIHDHVMTGQDSDGVSDLQKAFACWAALYVCGDALAITEADLDLLGAARRYDPENDLYLLAEACSLYARGDVAGAEALLKACFETRFAGPQPGDYLSILNPGKSTYQAGANSIPGAWVLPPAWVRTLDAAARSGQPVAAFCMVLIRDKEGKTALRDDYIGLFRAAGQTDHAAFHGYLDREMK
jgi:hypothetical protein